MDSEKFIALIILVAFPALARAKICPEKYKKFSANHSFCLDPNPNCAVVKQGLSQADKLAILAAHNKIRSTVATGQESAAGGLPQASNMLELEWDDEIAEIAQSWVLQCLTSTHDCNECRQVERFRVGQNVHKGSCNSIDGCTTPDWNYIIGRWYQEKDKFTKNLIKSYERTDVVIGHFTQIIWAGTSKVGCGFVVFKEDGKSTFLKSFVCNYGKVGNMLGSAVYEEGTSCSKCPSGTVCSQSYPGLCHGQSMELSINGCS